jgi:serine/threonine protein kinase/tetratricopeptide (TPR) repeat protein
LRERVERLLAAQSKVSRFLEAPAPALIGTVDVPPATERPGTLVGSYKLLEQIGEGGMGAVWMAEQTEPIQRRVAVKVVKEGMDSRQVLARFEAERQALALMEHPNIARVLDAGKTPSGRSYFVMELVKGQPITRYCDGVCLGVRERLELFGDVCRAVQHAHQKGIIHRDLKPSNVLVAPYDGRPVVKVIDFGIAKATGQRLTDQTLFTGFGALVGTPEYMSPEQAEVNNQDIDTRSDIYALGVLLYELLTGSPPFTRKDLEKVGMVEMLRVIREQEPTKPSTKLSTAEGLPTLAANRGTESKRLAALVRGELDWIVMKALEKDRNRRYETANGFALDVQRYLADVPVQACPPSAWYRLRKFARRNKARLAVVAGVFLAATVMAAIVGWALRDRAAREAEVKRQEEKRQEGMAQQAARALLEAQDLCRADRLPEAKAAVKRAEELLAGGGSDELHGRLSGVRRDIDMAGRVEEARLQRAAVKDGHFDDAGADRAYGEVFRNYSLDIAVLAPDQVAEKIRASAIREQLVAALDDWLNVNALADAGIEERLLAVLERADADSWRSQLRDAFRRRDAKALKELAADQRLSAQPPATVVLLGEALWRVGAFPLAIAVLRSAQQRHPNDFWINHHLAFTLAMSRPAEPGKAIGYYRAALALRPESPSVWHNLGLALYDNGELAEAVTALQRAIAFKPDYAEAHNSLGTAFHDAARPDEAIAEFREAIRLKNNYAEAHCNICLSLLDKGRVEEAIAECRKALRIAPKFAGAHCNLGSALKAKGQLDEAIIEYHEALRLKKDYAEAHLNLGLALYAKGQLDEAIAEFREALGIKKDYGKAHCNLGIALRAKGRAEEAIAELREAIRINPELAEAHNSLGNALHGRRQLEEAIAELREAIRIKPELAEAHYTLGNALRDKGRAEEAIAEFRAAIRIKPELAEAHCNLGYILRQKGQFREALEEVRRGHELGSRNPGWRYPSAEWVRQLERLVDLDRRLPGILERKTAPASPRECIELAGVCCRKQLHRAATRFYEEAFAADSKLQDDLGAAHRYYAACAAVSTAAGQGKDVDQIDDKEKARLRGQALSWLRADLAAMGRLLDREANPAPIAAAVARTLKNWQASSDLAGVRDAEALANVPEVERQAWHKLWDDAADLLARTQAKTTPEK